MFLPHLLLLALIISLASVHSLRYSKPNTTQTQKRVTPRYTIGYCELYPECTCGINEMESHIHCEGVVDITFEYRFHPERVSIYCHSGMTSDHFKYLSILKIKPSGFRGININMFACPLPNNSYSSLFLPTDYRKGSARIPRTIERLYIDCGLIKDFPIQPSHLAGLENLRVLGIYCRGLKYIQPDLLQGVSTELEELFIEKTSAGTLYPNLASRFTKLKYLILSQNKLKGFFKDLVISSRKLVEISLAHNAITEVDDDIFQTVDEIHKFEINDNRLTKLPDSLCNRPELITLDAFNNDLTYLDPECFAGFRSLLTLHVDGNKFQLLHPRLLAGTVSLNSFTIRSNFIEELPVTLVKPTNKLNNSLNSSALSDMGTISVEGLQGNFFSNTRYLETVDLRSNALKSLPDKLFFNCPSIYSVDISSNRLISLPPNLFQRNTRMRTLILSNNTLFNLSDSLLANQVSLVDLDLSKNRITTLGKDFFSANRKLEFIYLSDNIIQFLPNETFLPFNESATLKTVDLSRNLLQELPYLTLPSVTFLNLAENKLVKLTQKNFENLKSLEYLNISHNLLKDMDDMTFNSPYIKSIDLSHNLLDTSTDGWLQVLARLAYVFEDWHPFDNRYSMRKSSKSNPLPNLENLDFSNNKIISFYDIHQVAFGSNELQDLTGLKRLDLSKNKINFNDSNPTMDYRKKVWGCTTRISKLKNLEVLLLSHNEIEFIPMDWRHNLPSLKYLDLRYNNITYLWHQDFLFSNGITPEALHATPSISEKYFIKITKPTTYYKFSNSHRLTVDLRHNQIKGMEFPPKLMVEVLQDCHVDQQFGHATILLGDNPFICGCQVFQLLRYALKEVRPISELEKNNKNRMILPAKINIENLKCWYPSTMRGKYLSYPETWIHHLMPLAGLCLANTCDSTQATTSDSNVKMVS